MKQLAAAGVAFWLMTAVSQAGAFGLETSRQPPLSRDHQPWSLSQPAPTLVNDHEQAGRVSLKEVVDSEERPRSEPSVYGCAGSQADERTSRGIAALRRGELFLSVDDAGQSRTSSVAEGDEDARRLDLMLFDLPFFAGLQNALNVLQFGVEDDEQKEPVYSFQLCLGW